MPELASRLECTGCTACASACPNQCINMTENQEGFLYPEIDSSKCIECSLCVRSCPICSQLPIPVQETIAYAAYTKSSELRKESSSGGIFSELALAVLEQGGVVFGVAYSEQFEVNHICVESADELYRLRGAKYTQSSLEGIFSKVKSYLKQKRRVLFSGTPCQVAGLKAFLKTEDALLLCVDFVCHGVPSPAVWQSYVKYRSKVDNNGEMPLSIDMRSKESGWSYYRYSNVFRYEQKQWRSTSGDNLYMKIFVGDYINRLSCSNCQAKGYNRMSDITLGDFWGVWDIEPEMDDNKGTSLVLVHTQAAKSILEQFSDQIVLKKITLQQASKQNQSMLVSSPAPNKRETVIQKCLDGKFDELQGYFAESQKSPEAPLVNVLSRVWNKIKCILIER
jgi:coenzyme F420-reducing hydrogenase beta subunit